jgi:hypothetical protein
MRKTRSLRTRLNRLAPSSTAVGQDGDRTAEFVIDPAVAKTLWEDIERLHQMACEKSAARDYDDTRRRLVILEEGLIISQRIAERARAVGCPAGYGLNECRKDEDRLIKLRTKRMSLPSRGGGTLCEAENAEEAQLTARIAAFNESPEGQARIRELAWGGRGSAAEQKDEIDRLRMLYPRPLIVLNHPLLPAAKAALAAAAKFAEEDDQRSKQRAAERKARGRVGD